MGATGAAAFAGMRCAVAELAGTPRCVCVNDVPKLEEEDLTACFLYVIILSYRDFMLLALYPFTPHVGG